MPKKYSLKRKEEEVEIEGEDGVERIYKVKEMSGLERDAFLNVAGQKVRIGPDGKATGVRDFKGVHSDLLSRCLYDDTNTLVKADEINRWPSSVQSGLFDIAQRLSGLGNREAQEEEAKND